MRFKNLLGLLAIGGAVAYAQKKRGGDFSLASFKESFNNIVGNVKDKLGAMNLGGAADSSSASAPMASNGVGRGSDELDDAYSSGFSNGSMNGGRTMRH